MSPPSAFAIPKGLWRNPACFAALGFGSGYLPKAPGTFGTAVAVPFYLLLQPLSIGAYLITMAILFLGGIWLCDRCARAMGVHDHPAIVWDEVVGYLVTMVAAPAGWGWILLGFILFRFFDVLKPWPIRWVDRRVTGGFGIMLDDLLAAAFAWLLLQGVAAGFQWVA